MPRSRRCWGICGKWGIVDLARRHDGRWLTAVLLLLWSASPFAEEGCLACHGAETPAPWHRFAERACTACHGGDADATEQEAAHGGLIRFPGDLANAPRTCGGCHPRESHGVLHSPMHLGLGMVATTRAVLGEEVSGRDHRLQALGNSPADSMLRRLCAGCHLGRSKTDHSVDATLDRGGGCGACHVNAYPPDGHPALSARVEDGRCFGCHSRSGRVSLNYAGLGEVIADERTDQPLFRLADGRLVEHKPADLHHRAGMACIDCHTGPGVMEGRASPLGGRADIACVDCHAPQRFVSRDRWPADQRSSLSRIPFESKPGQRFSRTAAGTPLWHLELVGESAWLHLKLASRRVRVPQLTDAHRKITADHERLTCDACHAAWAPQCYGCHMDFDPEQEQWDHLEQREVAGRWTERRWDIRNDTPALGLRRDGRIDVAIPGMIMTLAHPAWDEPLRIERHAALSPHTSGPSRPCSGCHLGEAPDGAGERVVTPPLLELE